MRWALCVPRLFGEVFTHPGVRGAPGALEFKCDKTPEEALAQIDDRGYLVPFEADGRRLVKAGVNFSSETRTIDGWVIEEA